MAQNAPARRGRPPNAGASYRRVAEDLRRRMRSGEWLPGAVLPPWRSLAQTYGVGVRVIQRAAQALKQDGLLALSPQRRLIARDWDSPGTALESRILVLMTTSPRLFVGSPLSDELLLGVLRGAGDLTAPVLIAYDDRLCNHVPAELLEAPLRGVVIVGKISTAALRGWEKVAVPVVLADQPGGNWKLHASSVDNAAATREIVRRLLALGHRRIAFVRRMHTDHVHDVDPDSRERQRAFEAELAACGRTGIRTGIFSFFPKDTHAAPGIAAIFRDAQRFTAVIASDEGGASLVLQAAQERGVAVPRDLSVAAFSMLKSPKIHLSGPRFDFREIGRAAAVLAGAPRHPPLRKNHAGVWHEGRTIGPPPKLA